MNVTGVGAALRSPVQSLGDMRTQFGDLQRQLGTGKKSTTYAGLGIDRGLAVGLRSQLAAMTSYGETVTQVGVRINLQQTALDAHRRSRPHREVRDTRPNSSSTRAARPPRNAPRTRSSTRFSACSTRRPATATCSPGARSTSRRPTRLATSSTATAPRRASSRSWPSACRPTSARAVSGGSRCRRSPRRRRRSPGAARPSTRTPPRRSRAPMT